MKPYEDPKCRCHRLVDAINKRFPNADWNCDDACRTWYRDSALLKDNGIEFEPGSDECYGCTCPTCGNMVCGWCV